VDRLPGLNLPEEWKYLKEKLTLTMSFLPHNQPNKNNKYPKQ
jgi:hypothetical protein